MNKNETNEFSFLLKPTAHGVGVFVTHDIAKGTYLRLKAEERKPVARLRDKKDVPSDFLIYCIDREDGKLLCPPDFGHLHLVWYLNHSFTPNAVHDADYNYHALRDIRAGEEITIDYNSLEEPEESKEDYYVLGSPTS